MPPSDARACAAPPPPRGPRPALAASTSGERRKRRHTSAQKDASRVTLLSRTRPMTRRAKLAPESYGKRKTCGLFLLSLANGHPDAPLVAQNGRHTIPNPKRKPNSERWSPETAATPMPKPTGYGTRPHPLAFHIYTLLHL